jgi:hypothetical protein
MARLSAIATAAQRIKAKSFTINGEAVVLGPGGLSLSDELRRRKAADTAILYAFDLIEHEGEDVRNHPIPRPQGRAGAPVAQFRAGILFNEYIAEDGPCTLRTAWRMSAPRVYGSSTRCKRSWPLTP